MGLTPAPTPQRKETAATAAACWIVRIWKQGVLFLYKEVCFHLRVISQIPAAHWDSIWGKKRSTWVGGCARGTAAGTPLHSSSVTSGSFATGARVGCALF